eukprot:9472850-Heterocapsa_arctica.AAC.1
MVQQDCHKWKYRRKEDHTGRQRITKQVTKKGGWTVRSKNQYKIMANRQSRLNRLESNMKEDEHIQGFSTRIPHTEEGKQVNKNESNNLQQVEIKSYEQDEKADL